MLTNCNTVILMYYVLCLHSVESDNNIVEKLTSSSRAHFIRSHRRLQGLEL